MTGTAPVQQTQRRPRILTPAVRRVAAALWGKVNDALAAVSWQVRPRPRAVIIGNSPLALRVATSLRLWGIESHVSGSTAEVISQAAGVQPDIIIADLVLPGTNAIDSVCELRRSLPNSTVCLYSSAMLGDSRCDLHPLVKAVLDLAAGQGSRDNVYLLLRGNATRGWRGRPSHSTKVPSN